MEPPIWIITIYSFLLQESLDIVKSSEAFQLKVQQLSELQWFGSRNTLVTVRGTNVVVAAFGLGYRLGRDKRNDTRKTQE